MSSNLVVGIPPVAPFQQTTSRKRKEVLNLEFSSALFGSTATDPVLRVTQLEQNIRFLQEHHQIMLNGLHREIEILRQRNKELQIQMVFNKPATLSMFTTPNSSPEDDQRKIVVSPGPINMVPLQVEILQRDITDLRTSLNEAKSKNEQLQEQLERKTKPVDVDPEVNEKLEETERMVRRLKRENEEQRKEIVSLRNTTSKLVHDQRGNSSGIQRTKSTQNQYTQTTRFPPLHQHTYWNNSSKNNLDYHRKSRNGGLNDRASTVLPHLRTQNGHYYNSNNQSGNNYRRHYNGQNRWPQDGGSRTFHHSCGNRDSEYE